jgi:hypothetical protein
MVRKLALAEFIAYAEKQWFATFMRGGNSGFPGVLLPERQSDRPRQLNDS